MPRAQKTFRVTAEAGHAGMGRGSKRPGRSLAQVRGQGASLLPIGNLLQATPYIQERKPGQGPEEIWACLSYGNNVSLCLRNW